MTVAFGGPEGEGASQAPEVRPAVLALLGAQPVPVFLVTPSGPPVANAAAERFIMDSERGPRVLLHDGTDLWTIIAGRSDEASPFFDMHTRLRTGGGQAVEVIMSVVPLRGPGGVLSGAVVFVLSTPGERLDPPTNGSADSLHDVLEWIGALLNPGRICVTEFDDDVAPQAKMRGYWSGDGTPPPPCTFSLAAVPAGAFGGKRVLVVPSGLEEQFPEADGASGFQSYAGVILTNHRGEAIGVLGATWREPITDIAGVTAVLCIAGAQASRALSESIAHRELKESEQRYGAVFEGSGMPIVLIEPSTTQIVDANPAACAYYGFSHDEFTSMSILQLDTMGAEALQAELTRAIDGSRDRFVAQHILSGGHLRDVEVGMGPIQVAGRKLLYCMINDVTERRRMEAALERSKHSLERVVGQRTEDLLRANAELQHASMSRDAMLGNLGQELRTSVQTITGFSGLLLKGIAGDLTGEQRRQVEMVQRAGDRLSSFASALMEAQQAESLHAPAADEFDIVSLVKSVVLGLDSFADDKGLALEFSAQESAVTVRSDRYKVQQVLLNLLSNAIRYTQSGSVIATVNACTEGFVTIAVSDTGMGIDPASLASLFDVPEPATGKAGIGLPASMQIARALGGSIEVESTPGAGSRFSLKLPCMEAEQEKDRTDE